MHAVSLSSVYLALCSVVGALEYDYPADIEIDVLFPRDETYNNLTSFPVVLAIQDVKAAYRFEWEVQWKVYSAAPDADEYDYFSGYGSYSGPLINTFQWYFDDVAIVPLQGYNFTRLKAGPYRLEWEYLTTPCTNEPPNTIVYNIREVVASGSQTFSIVDDGSGLDFDIPTDACPLYGGLWSVYESTSTYCPFLRDNEDDERDPCKAQLESQQQVECIREYLFEGTREAPVNETEVCRSSFKRVDLDWYRSLYEIENYEDDGDDDESDVDEVSDVDNVDDDDVQGQTDQDSVDEDDSSSGSTQDREDDEDVAALLRPGMFGVGLAAVAALVVL
ncbi:hypothetical protein BDV12DRAFT_145823 [Aspergillus spectabilis]